MLAASALRSASEAAVLGAPPCVARHVGASGGTGLVVFDDRCTRRGLCGRPRGGEVRATVNVWLCAWLGVAFSDGPAVRVAFMGRRGHALLFWVAMKWPWP